MRKIFYTSKNKAISITVMIIIGFVIAFGLLIYSIVSDYIFESLFFLFIILTGLFILKDSIKKGIYDRVVLTEEGIQIKRPFSTVILDTDWNNIASMNIINNGIVKKIKIDCVDKESKKSYSFQMNDNEQAMYLLKSYYDEYRLKVASILDENNTSGEKVTNKEYSLKKYEGKGVFNIENKKLKGGWVFIHTITALLILFNVARNFAFDSYLENTLQKIITSALLIVGWSLWVRLMYRKVFINEMGIRMVSNSSSTKRFFYWDDIKTIGIGVHSYGVESTSGFLYFSTSEIENDKVIDSYIEEEDIIVMRYNPKIVHCIFNYWDGEIKNLENEKSWLKYVNKFYIK